MTPRPSPGVSTGQVVKIVGRRVVVRNGDGERVCFLSGQRAVVGDRVRWVVAKGSGGKIVGVEPRDTTLRRLNMHGRDQVVAANLRGIVVVDTGTAPPLNPSLIDRYIVGARRDGLEVVFALNKLDLGVPDEVAERMALWESLGVRILRLSAHDGTGLDELRALIAEPGGPWALVGRSGVGKTSLVAALLPEQDVGPVGDLSEYWGMGKHTTTGSCLFDLQTGGTLVDSPGIRQFTPGGLDTETMRLYFPGFGEVQCRYRDCLHRPDEDGCGAPDAVPETLLRSYRALLAELLEVEERHRP